MGPPPPHGMAQWKFRVNMTFQFFRFELGLGSSLFVMEIVTLQPNLTNICVYLFMYTL